MSRNVSEPPQTQLFMASHRDLQLWGKMTKVMLMVIDQCIICIVSDTDGAADTDEDIIMPEGPPPGNDLEKGNIDSDDDIPMPEGPPPNAQSMIIGNFPAFRTNGSLDDRAQFQPGISAAHFSILQSPVPPASFLPPFLASFVPPPPPPSGFEGNVYPPYLHGNHAASTPFLPPSSAMQPVAPPPGFFPHQAVHSRSPLLSQKYQAQNSNRPVVGHPSLPPKPSTTSGPSASVLHSSASATITAEPELRDLKKEAIAFVPPSLKRKKVSASPATSRVNAAPSVSIDGSESQELPATVRPDLVSALRDQFGAPPPPQLTGTGSSKEPAPKSKDDYQKFLEEMGDILGPSQQ